MSLVSIEQRVKGLLDEGIHVWKAEFLTEFGDPFIVKCGHLSSHSGSENLKPEYVTNILERRIYPEKVKLLENGVEMLLPQEFNVEGGVRIKQRLPDYIVKELEDKQGHSTHGVGCVYFLGHPMLEYFLKRKGWDRNVLEAMISQPRRDEVLNLTGSSSPSAIAYSSGDSVELSLQYHRIVANPNGVWTPVFYFKLPSEEYGYDSMSLGDPVSEERKVKEVKSFGKLTSLSSFIPA